MPMRDMRRGRWILKRDNGHRIGMRVTKKVERKLNEEERHRTRMDTAIQDDRH